MMELENLLHQLKDKEKQAYFCLKKSEEAPEGGLWIEANRNGVLDFCGFLLKSIDRTYLEKQSVYHYCPTKVTQKGYGSIGEID